jgi:hypothetical protein
MRIASVCPVLRYGASGGVSNYSAGVDPIAATRATFWRSPTLGWRPALRRALPRRVKLAKL